MDMYQCTVISDVSSSFQTAIAPINLLRTMQALTLTIVYGHSHGHLAPRRDFLEFVKHFLTSNT